MAVAIERHTNRRTLVVFYAAGLRAGSARLVRGSSRRMTTMRFRPAYIRVINRRNSRSIATDVACGYVAYCVQKLLSRKSGHGTRLLVEVDLLTKE